MPSSQLTLFLGQSLRKFPTELLSLSLTMSTNKKKLLLNTVSVNLGCSSCKKPKLSHIFQPKPKPKTTTYYQKHKKDIYYSSSSTSTTNPSPNDIEYYGSSTPTTFSPTADTPPQYFFDNNKKCSRTVRGFGRVGGESVAVEKDSDDPYLDFRRSMLQMILEKEIYSKDDLRELLDCFLQLNSPYHHGIIVRAFTEIWNGVFSVRSASSATHPPTAAAATTTTTGGLEKQQLHYYYGF